MDLEFLQVEFDKEWADFLELMAPVDPKPLANEPLAAAAEPPKKKMTHTEFLYDQCPELRKVMENFAGSDLEVKDVKGPSGKGSSSSSSSSSASASSSSPPKPVARGRNRAWVESLKDKYTVIKGHVQSGKTNFMICASALFVSMGYSVVHLLRDRTSDRDQIHARLLNFQEDHNKAFGQTMRVIGAGAKKSTDLPQIYLALCNKPSVTKVLTIVNASERPYILFIDEVDFVDSGDATKKYEAIQDMKKGAYCVFGVSATIMDPLGKENITSKNIILLGTASKHGNYKGLDRIQLLEVDPKCKYTGLVDSNLFKEDEGLKPFIDEFVTRQPIRYMASAYPNICLVNICRTKGPCFKAQADLGKSHPKLATIVYNGDGISFRQGKIVMKERTTISKCLQKLKDNGGVAKYPHILIFAGDLAGRCISFVSEDYKWHLSDQRLLISSSCDEPELIQKIRLCGIYDDEIPLKLYTTKKTIAELRKAYLRQEEIICALKSREDAVENTRTIMESMALDKDKFSRRSTTKDEKAEVKMTKVDVDGGWDVDAYKMTKEDDGTCVPKALPPASFYEAYGQEAPSEAYRKAYEEEHEDEEVDDDNVDEKKDIEYVIHMFKKWSSDGTKIARFMQDLDPEKVYTKDEIQEIDPDWMKSNYTHFFQRKTANGSKGYGKILEETRDGVRLRPCLVEAFKSNFNWQQ